MKLDKYKSQLKCCTLRLNLERPHANMCLVLGPHIVGLVLKWSEFESCVNVWGGLHRDAVVLLIFHVSIKTMPKSSLPAFSQTRGDIPSHFLGTFPSLSNQVRCQSDSYY